MSSETAEAVEGRERDRLQRYGAGAQPRLGVLEPAVRVRPPHVHNSESAVDVAPLEREQLRRSKPGRGCEHNHWPVDRAEPNCDRL